MPLNGACFLKKYLICPCGRANIPARSYWISSKLALPEAFQINKGWAVKPSTALAAAPKTAPDAKSSAPTAAEQKPESWKVNALSMTVTMSVAYTLCAIFDVLFPPFGLLAALAPTSPLPISGSLLAYLTGFALFTVAGFVFGALHGIAWKFWRKRIR